MKEDKRIKHNRRRFSGDEMYTVKHWNDLIGSNRNFTMYWDKTENEMVDVAGKYLNEEQITKLKKKLGYLYENTFNRNSR